MLPSLSDDAWRYLWDGRLIDHGVNPYYVVPADSSLASLHDELYRRQGYPTTHTIYPPGAQLVFAAAMAPSTAFDLDTLVGYYLYKIFLIGAEVVAIAMLLAFREHQGRSFTPAILYAWHPLPIVELAGQGHTDALWVATIGLALVAYARRGWGSGLPWLALGGAFRLYPLALMPLWLSFLGWRRWWRGLVLSIPFLLLLGVFLDPLARETFTTVLIRFTNYYEFNGGAYYGLKWLVDLVGLQPSNRIAGGICTAIMLLLHLFVVYKWRRGGSATELAGAVLALLTIQVTLGAKAHVWYFAAPLYLAAMIDGGSLRRGWLWLTLFAPVTYVHYLLDPPVERMWVVAVEWVVAAGLWLGIWVRGKRIGGDTHTRATPGSIS